MKPPTLLVAVLALALAACTKKPTQAEADIAACRVAIRATLTDPDSAQFEGEHLVAQDAHERIYTLTVNAKNRMGGYAGRHDENCAILVSTGKVDKVF